MTDKSQQQLTLDEACERLKENDATLTTLDLSSTKVGDPGCTALAFALKRNTHLLELHLGNAHIGSSGAVTLAHTLKTNQRLERLYLQSNRIGDKGAQALADACQQNATLRLLNLARNEIGDIGAAALAEGIVAHERLRKLYLYDNVIANTGATAIAELVANNEILQEVFLWDNKIGEQGLMELNAAYILASQAGRKIHLRTHWKLDNVVPPASTKAAGVVAKVPPPPPPPPTTLSRSFTSPLVASAASATGEEGAVRPFAGISVKSAASKFANGMSSPTATTARSFVDQTGSPVRAVSNEERRPSPKSLSNGVKQLVGAWEGKENGAGAATSDYGYGYGDGAPTKAKMDYGYGAPTSAQPLAGGEGRRRRMSIASSTLSYETGAASSASIIRPSSYRGSAGTDSSGSGGGAVRGGGGRMIRRGSVGAGGVGQASGFGVVPVVASSSSSPLPSPTATTTSLSQSPTTQVTSPQLEQCTKKSSGVIKEVKPKSSPASDSAKSNGGEVPPPSPLAAATKSSKSAQPPSPVADAPAKCPSPKFSSGTITDEKLASILQAKAAEIEASESEEKNGEDDLTSLPVEPPMVQENRQSEKKTAAAAAPESSPEEEEDDEDDEDEDQAKESYVPTGSLGLLGKKQHLESIMESSLSTLQQQQMDQSKSTIAELDNSAASPMMVLRKEQPSSTAKKIDDKTSSPSSSPPDNSNSPVEPTKKKSTSAISVQDDADVGVDSKHLKKAKSRSAIFVDSGEPEEKSTTAKEESLHKEKTVKNERLAEEKIDKSDSKDKTTKADLAGKKESSEKKASEERPFSPSLSKKKPAAGSSRELLESPSKHQSSKSGSERASRSGSGSDRGNRSADATGKYKASKDDGRPSTPRGSKSSTKKDVGTAGKEGIEDSTKIKRKKSDSRIRPTTPSLHRDVSENGEESDKVGTLKADDRKPGEITSSSRSSRTNESGGDSDGKNVSPRRKTSRKGIDVKAIKDDKEKSERQSRLSATKEGTKEKSERETRASGGERASKDRERSEHENRSGSTTVASSHRRSGEETPDAAKKEKVRSKKGEDKEIRKKAMSPPPEETESNREKVSSPIQEGSSKTKKRQDTEGSESLRGSRTRVDAPASSGSFRSSRMPAEPNDATISPGRKNSSRKETEKRPSTSDANRECSAAPSEPAVVAPVAYAEFDPTTGIAKITTEGGGAAIDYGYGDSAPSTYGYGDSAPSTSTEVVDSPRRSSRRRRSVMGTETAKDPIEGEVVRKSGGTRRRQSLGGAGVGHHDPNDASSNMNGERKQGSSRKGRSIDASRSNIPEEAPREAKQRHSRSERSEEDKQKPPRSERSDRSSDGANEEEKRNGSTRRRPSLASGSQEIPAPTELKSEKSSSARRRRSVSGSETLPIPAANPDKSKDSLRRPSLGDDIEKVEAPSVEAKPRERTRRRMSVSSGAVPSDPVSASTDEDKHKKAPRRRLSMGGSMSAAAQAEMNNAETSDDREKRRHARRRPSIGVSESGRSETGRSEVCDRPPKSSQSRAPDQATGESRRPRRRSSMGGAVENRVHVDEQPAVEKPKEERRSKRRSSIGGSMSQTPTPDASGTSSNSPKLPDAPRPEKSSSSSKEPSHGSVLDVKSWDPRRMFKGKPVSNPKEVEDAVRSNGRDDYGYGDGAPTLATISESTKSSSRGSDDAPAVAKSKSSGITKRILKMGRRGSVA